MTSAYHFRRATRLNDRCSFVLTDGRERTHEAATLYRKPSKSGR
jgi:hypothetical protein